MRVEQGVKIASGSVSVTEDFKEGEIVVIEHINDIEEMYVVKRIINGSIRFNSVAMDVFRHSMIPKIENKNLCYKVICDCYDLETAIEIAKALNEMRGER